MAQRPRFARDPAAARRRADGEGAYDRHIRRMQRQYRMRRDALVNALRKRFGSQVEILGQEAGLHVIAEFRSLPAQRVGELTDACRRPGVGVYTPRNALVVFGNPPDGARDRARLLLGYGLAGVEQFEHSVKVLAEEYRRLKPSRGRVQLPSGSTSESRIVPIIIVAQRDNQFVEAA